MANRIGLIVFLLSLQSLCASGFNCTFGNVTDVLFQSCLVRQIGSYRIPSDMPSAWNESTWRCIVLINGNQEGITRRIQIFDDNMNVGACSGQITLSYDYSTFSQAFLKRSNMQLCGRENSESFTLHSNLSAISLPISVDSKVNLTVENVFVNGKPVLGNEVELPVNSTWETLTIKYQKGFPSSLYFTYILKSENSTKIEISVLDLDMGGYNSSTHCEDDYIDITDARTKHRWCQGRHSLTSQGPILYITLRTDAQGSARGFELRYRKSPILPPASTTHAPTWTTDVGWSYATVNATEHPQILTNRTDLIFYYFHVDYNWTIQTSLKLASRIKVTFTNVDLGEEVKCSQARVTLSKGTFDDSDELDVLCGRVTPGVSFSWLSPLTIRLQTNGIAPAHMRGFLLEYQSTAADEVDSCNSTVQVYSNATYLTFASRASGPADSVECWWKLRAPSRSRVSLQSEVLNLQGPGPLGCSDWLQVYNGLSSNAAPLSEKVCGSTSVSVASTGQTMLVRFHTDSNEFSSFRLRVQTYESLPSPGTSKDTSADNDSTSPLAVIWSTVFCLFGLIVITIVTVCCCYQCRKREKRSRRPVQTGNNVTLQSTQGDRVAMETRSDLERQIQSVSVSFISASVFWNGAFSEQPPPYPGPRLETSQEDPPPSYASLKWDRDTLTHADVPPPPYSEM